MKKPKSITVKTGSVKDFFVKMKKIMVSADRAEQLEPSHTLIFENPTEMLHFLSAAKIRLIDCIRHHPGSITTIAQTINRNRAAVYRDIHELEEYGLVRVHDEVNPGHGRHKIVELVANQLKLEAYL